MTKSISRSQVRLIASTNAIFGADEACAMLRISRDAMYRARQGPRRPVPDPLHRRQDARRHRAARRARRMGRAEQHRRLAQKGLAPMAAAGPKGRDGPSPREFTTVRHFMMADLGPLRPFPARLRAHLRLLRCRVRLLREQGRPGRFLNVQERSVHRAIRDLLDRGLIEECGMHAPARGHATKRYRIVRERLPPGALATPDDSSGFPARKGDEMTGSQRTRMTNRQGRSQNP